MKLSDNQIKDLQYHILRKAPTISSEQECSSRRIEGAFTMDLRDAKGYESVIVYIERGLGDKAEVINQVLRVAAAVQARERLNYPVCLFSFGWEDDALHHTGKNKNGYYYSAINSWVQELCDLAGMDKSTGVIPALFPLANPYGIKRRVSKNDLLVFFCKDRSVKMRKGAYDYYCNISKVSKRPVWIFCGGNSVEMELGSFIPECLDS